MSGSALKTESQKVTETTTLTCVFVSENYRLGRWFKNRCPLPSEEQDVEYHAPWLNCCSHSPRMRNTSANEGRSAKNISRMVL